MDHQVHRDVGRLAVVNQTLMDKVDPKQPRIESEVPP